ncbi:MAG: hypothetical protein JST30_06530 [Armatimonadetes bacterium]|nr:hypothetical protein [Armatimonadota bacterium]
MFGVVVAIPLFALAYGFGPGTKLTYDANVTFEGFLPLMGGNEGKVDVKMAVAVAGAEPVEGYLKSTSEIKEFDVSFNDAKLPLDLSNVTELFPKTTITLAPTGRIATTDAPDKKLPVRLPGLDVKHFPDVTYVPIELPSHPEAGVKWTFAREFGSAPIDYECELGEKTGDLQRVKVKLKQSYRDFESKALETVKEESDAEWDVTTTMNGEGWVDFDTVRGAVSQFEIKNTAIGQAKNLKTGKTSERKLVTKYVIKLREGAGVVRKSVSPNSAEWWRNAVETGKNALAWLKTASYFGLQSLPKNVEALIGPFRQALGRWFPVTGGTVVQVRPDVAP